MNFRKISNFDTSFFYFLITQKLLMIFVLCLKRMPQLKEPWLVCHSQKWKFWPQDAPRSGRPVKFDGTNFCKKILLKRRGNWKNKWMLPHCYKEVSLFNGKVFEKCWVCIPHALSDNKNQETPIAASSLARHCSGHGHKQRFILTETLQATKSDSCISIWSSVRNRLAPVNKRRRAWNENLIRIKWWLCIWWEQEGIIYF